MSQKQKKAYENLDFIRSRDARGVRILCEYLEPLQQFQKMGVRETIVIFGSARAKPAETLEAEYQKLNAEKKKYKGSLPAKLSQRLERMHWERKLSEFYEQSAELACLLTKWAKSLDNGKRFVICSGGGPGIMEGANRGATERADGLSVGLTISLPTEEDPNPYITPELISEFHYFFMRKLWFMYMASAIVVFPGGFGTMDELFETLTLVQTRKIERPLPVILYGKEFWNDFLNFDALVKWGTISPPDMKLFKIADSPKEAFDFLKRKLLQYYPKPQTWNRKAP
jgi:hypothetical protein